MTDLTAVTEVTAEDLRKWYELQQRMAADKTAEALLRSRIYKQFFPTPKEGTNNHPLEDGTGAVLKAKRVVNRKVLEPELDAYKSNSKEEGSNLPKLPWNKLIKYEPKLSMSEYNKLTNDEKKACDMVLEIKDGSPQLEITIPKRAVK
jgi:hypothetical protein